MTPKEITLLYYSASGKSYEPSSNTQYRYHTVCFPATFTQNEFLKLLQSQPTEDVLVLNADEISSTQVGNIVNAYFKEKRNKIFYGNRRYASLLSGFIDKNLKMVNPEILNASFFIGKMTLFEKAYAATDLAQNPLRSIAFSLQKNFTGFSRLTGNFTYQPPFPSTVVKEKSRLLNYRYQLQLPFRYLASGSFFKNFFHQEDRPQRHMVCRMLMILFAVFTFLYMPYISKDFGITGDEFVDQRHAGYVLNYYLHGDKTAVHQPKTFLHFYGISMQIIAEGICQLFNVDDYFAVRHAMTAIIGAGGIWYAGLLGLRWGGGLCGLLSMLLLFFTPRYFGNSMNNMKDIPFATGYIMSIFYFIRLFDFYPYFRLRYIIGAILGITIAFGSRSGGLMLYPYLLMYAGLFYILQVGFKEFYKFYKHRLHVIHIFNVLLLVFIVSYILSIALWPYALEHPFSGIAASLKQFTNFTVALKLMFDGKEMMSNMVPVSYAPTFLSIGLPIVLLIGFWGYLIWLFIKRKEFSLISWMLLFAAVFPILWVMYKNSNLYGGIRHFMFVVTILAVIAAKFWTLLIQSTNRIPKIGLIALIGILLSLPLFHMLRNHPHEYIYFNEFIGGIKGAYGKYDTDYYYNSLKHSTEWFKKNVELPKDRKTIIMSNMTFALEQYFKKDTNVRIIYSRYYEKYSKDWDYAILANEYITPYQLQHQLFPPPETIYSATVDGYAVGVVLKRTDKEELEGFRLEGEGKYRAALDAFEKYTTTHPDAPEEILSRMAKLYYINNQFTKAREYADKALRKHPLMVEALHMSTLIYIKQRDFTAALKDAQKMLDANKSSYNGYYLRALAYFYLRKYQEAVNDLNKTLAINPKFSSALFLAGDIMNINRNYSTAVEIYQKILKNSNDIKAATALADCYCKMKNYTEMEKLLQNILQSTPNYLTAYNIKVRSLLQQNKLQEAAQLLSQLAAVDNDSELFVLRALYLHSQKKTDEARKMLEIALQIDPDNIEAEGLKKNLK